jgi:hypothetical protein
MCLSRALHVHLQADVDLFPICSQQQIPNNVISDVRWTKFPTAHLHASFVSRSYDYQQPRSAAAEMDPSVLWCLGPDFDKQTVLSLLGDSNYIDSCFMQPTTPTWGMSSPSQWNTSSMHEPPVYTPRSVMSELGPQSPTSGATKRPFSDVSNRATSK